MFSPKTVQPLKTQHFIRMRLKTPTVDIAPVKLYPYVTSKTQTQMHEFASCFCPYRLYPHDTLCTYGAKQLKLLGFSQRHLFGCSLMDFKTDYIDGDLNEKAARYAPQLRAYAQALSRIYDFPVRKTILYFFSVGHAVEISPE